MITNVLLHRRVGKYSGYSSGIPRFPNGEGGAVRWSNAKGARRDAPKAPRG